MHTKQKIVHIVYNRIMKNVYFEACGIVFITVKYKETSYDCRVDSADLPKLLDLDVSWYANPAKASAGKFYVMGKHKRKTLMLHRVILGLTDERFVNHKDNDGLNNTRENLEICTPKENTRAHWQDRDWTDYDKVEE